MEKEKCPYDTGTRRADGDCFAPSEWNCAAFACSYRARGTGEQEVNPSREPEPVKGEGVVKQHRIFDVLNNLCPHVRQSPLLKCFNGECIEGTCPLVEKERQTEALLTSAIKGERERVCKRISEEIEERCFGMSHIAFSTLDEVIEKLRKG